MPTLKGTEASLSYIQCFLYLVSSSINVSICHYTWLGTFWTDLVFNPYNHFIEGETEILKVDILSILIFCPKSHYWQAADPIFESSLV